VSGAVDSVTEFPVMETDLLCGVALNEELQLHDHHRKSCRGR
jgi:hypothetical protein